MYLSNNNILQRGKYEIVRHISSGGFGNTYEGVHTMLDTRIAIKEFFPKLFCNRDENTARITVATQSNRELVERLRKKFIDEAKAIFKMNHPNIVKVHDIFEENGTAYYVMDYIDGKSLGQIVKERGALPEAEAVDYIRQVADALKHVHSLNRLHLDIKPSNVMVDTNGHATLIDFGTSKYYDMESGENTSTLMGVNTKGYAPIEQSTQNFTKFSPATDIYALGATMYKLLTGITPPDANLLMAKEETLASMPSNISSSTRNAVIKSMTLIRADRPQNIETFLSLLDEKTVDNTDDEVTVCENEILKNQTEKTRQQEAKEQKYGDGGIYLNKRGNYIPQIWIVAAVAIGIIAIIGTIIETYNKVPYTANVSQESESKANGSQVPSVANNRAERGTQTCRFDRIGVTTEGSNSQHKKQEILDADRIKVTTEENNSPEIAYITNVDYINGKLFVKGVGYAMVKVRAGTFTMGATAEMEDPNNEEKPIHQVILTNDYYIGETEVTQALWKAVMGNNPSYFKGDNRPVEQVSWNDCQKFVSKLNAMTGKKFRLPTEAEWEFAARGGNNSNHYQYSGSNILRNVAWYDETGTHNVATKLPNELGIYDMSGNVWEWCYDNYSYYNSRTLTNPIVTTSSDAYRVFRGGSFRDQARYCRTSYRNRGSGDNNIGFRLVLEAQ